MSSNNAGQFTTALAVTLAACVASAQAPVAAFQLGGGVDVRHSHLDEHTQKNVVAPMARVGVEGWFLPFLGIEASLLGELDGTCCDGVKSPLLRFSSGSAAVTGRYRAESGFWLRGALGYGGSSAPALVGNVPSPLQTSGLTGALEVGIEHQRFQGSLTGSVLVPMTGAIKITQVEPRLWLAVKLGDAGLTGWWLGADASAFMEFGGARYSGVTVRAGLGLRVALRMPDAPKPVALPEAVSSGGLALSITAPGGLPLAGSRIIVDGALVSEEASAVLLHTLTAGQHVVQVQHEGFRSWYSTFDVRDGRKTELRAELIVPTGPGTLRGVVLDFVTRQPIAGARIFSGSREVKADNNGAFVFSAIGPGLVPLRGEATGYTIRDEVAQLAPEGETSLTVWADKLGRGAPAELRGLIDSRRGSVSAATVRVDGQREPLTLGRDGRFSVKLPAGTYTLSVTAPGFAPQTHRLALTEGEQTVFHVQLLPK